MKREYDFSKAVRGRVLPPQRGTSLADLFEHRRAGLLRRTRGAERHTARRDGEHAVEQEIKIIESVK
jgi:hypothetical protein